MIDVLMAAVIAMSHPQAPVDTTTTVIEEDSPAWDCRVDGNRICGPDNAQGVTPGDYSDPNCWPGAIYCPAPGTQGDVTVR